MSNLSQLAWLVPIFPLIGFLINGLGRNYLSKTLVGIIGSGALLLSFITSVLIFNKVSAGELLIGEAGVYFDFIKFGSFNIPFAFQIDQLTSIFLLVITGVGFLIHVYSTSYMHEETKAHFARYFAYLNLFVFSMLLLVMGANYVIMFIGWEGVGLCSYLLIGYWFKNNDYTNAAKKAFVMNRIGDLGFLIAIFYLIQHFGTTTYIDIFSQAKTEGSSSLITIITLCLFVGAMGKSAQLPLYTWLPDAMAGPTPVSALIHAATMVTAGIYMIARSNVLYALAPSTMSLVAIVGLLTAVFAASIALKQNDIKKVLAYSTVSQLGYMFLGLGVGAFTGAVFHVMTHAFFKALLFLGAGSVIHAMHHQQDMRHYGGLKKYMPVTNITMLIGCLAIAGIPPFSGFFSKDEILIAAYAANPIYYVIGLFGALMTAFYMFRMYTMTFLGGFRGDHHHLPHESPKPMTFALVVLAILAAVAGFIGLPELFTHNPEGHKLANYLAPVFKDGEALLAKHAHPDHTTEWILLAVSVGLIVAVILWAVKTYKVYKLENDAEPQGFSKILANKWYVDEIYDAVIIKPILAIGDFFGKVIETKGIDKAVNGVGKAINFGSRKFRYLQSGNVGNYILIMIVAIIILVRILFYLPMS
ncbi:NADH-quinone oxidoreductase subunit L [Polluticaenibacter yanchengensis]|uniref:NADH-quinone oxidoreductase subunit L n=1 Tax=Polluticaenibacter yanchengensis TaxID=3014562 RepID=A0ABT4UEU3_9BACT|nr:NADH-quinone oxidoreductase subunit L [Chitinophagaceae bacterium LY-5]